MDKKHLQHNILSAPYDRATWHEVLIEYFGVKRLHQNPTPILLSANDITDYAVELGSFDTADDRLVGIYEITLKENSTTKIAINRVGLRNLLRSVYKYDVDGALIVFIHGNKWRFSYVSEISTEEGKMETEPKRYTYLFGQGESCRTAADRFENIKDKAIYLSDLYDAFSVEKLNKDFFKTYKEFYKKGVDFLVAQPDYYNLLNDKKQSNEDKKQKPIRDFVKKLLGRLVFLQFLQKKEWMGVSLANNEWKDGDQRFIQSLFEKYTNKAHFHSTALKMLFFETLNSKRTNDKAPDSLGNDIKIPYLNGGLFDKDISFFNAIDFPQAYFHDLFDFFEQYNFTIDENDPLDSEVGIDPEMLGHIFENLLEENREKGAFYTPKEIVHYMCHESLIQYLRTHLPECTEDDSPATKELEDFICNGTINRTNPKSFIVRTAPKIEKLLDNVKICDPAIGSGAFPMGMLHEIFNAKMALDLTLDPAKVKKDIIQDNIYGVDIENGAVDIARLRFWLALVVDETEPQPLPNLDYKIMQGNSLLEQFDDILLKFERKVFEVKVVKQVDLFGRVIDPQFTINEYLQTKQHSKEFHITELEDKYFNSSSPDEKQQIRQKIEDFEHQFIAEQLAEREKNISVQIADKEADLNKDLQAVSESQRNHIINGRKAKEIAKLKQELDKIIQNKHRLAEIKPGDKPWFLWHLYFMDVFDKGGFDIVIGNPPYIQMQKDAGDLAKMLKNSGYTTYERTGDIYAVFYELGFKLLKKNGIHTFITSSQWLRANYGKSLRQYFLTKNVIKLIELGPGIFESAVVDTNILVAKNADNKKILKGAVIKDVKEIQSVGSIYMQPMPYVNEDAWAILNPIKQAINNKIEKNGKQLKDWNVEIYFGIKTGLNEVFIIDEDRKNELVEKDLKAIEIIKPILRGRGVNKYYTEWDGGYIIATFPALTVDIDKYKSVKEYLESFLPKIKQTGEEFINSDGVVEKTRKKTYNEWYETQDQIGYYEEFSKEKVIWKRIGSQLRFSYSNEEIFCLDSTCIATGENIKYLTALLNSKLCHYQLFEKSPKTGMGDLIISVHALEPIYVYYPKENELETIELLVNKILVAKKDKSDTLRWENKIDALVFHYYGLTEDEMLHVLDSFRDLSIKERNQIQNEYWNIANNKFQIEL